MVTNEATKNNIVKHFGDIFQCLFYSKKHAYLSMQRDLLDIIQE